MSENHILVETHAEQRSADIVVGVPSYNEADSIGFVIQQAEEAILRQGRTFRKHRRRVLGLHTWGHAPEALYPALNVRSEPLVQPAPCSAPEANPESNPSPRTAR